MNRCIRIVVLALMVMLGTTGCAGTNVGGSWQCPLAQGEACASVAAADPAVPAMPEKSGAAPPAGEGPLYRPRTDAGRTCANVGKKPATEAEKKCGGVFPFGWLARLFSSDTHAASVSVSDDAGPEDSAAPAADAAAADISMSGSIDALPDDAQETRRIVPEDAREPERIGRVWIGPFVDADGVYREASWVRIVISPGSWRLP